MAKRGKTKKSSGGKAKKAKAKKSKVQRVAASAEDPYCLFECSSGTWHLITSSHGSGSTCPELHGTCTPEGQQTKVLPISNEMSASRKVPINSGDYVFSEGTLHLTRSKQGKNHFCPPRLSLQDLFAIDPELTGVIHLLAAQKNIVGVTVNVKAQKKQKT
jgi:hypothetical protein